MDKINKWIKIEIKKRCKGGFSLLVLEIVYLFCILPTFENIMQAADSFLVDSNCLILKYLISNYLSVKTFVLSRAKIHKEREIFKTVCCVKCKYSQYFHSYFALLVWNSSKRKENVAKKR